MKFRELEIQRWEKWGSRSPIYLFAGPFVIYFLIGLGLEHFDLFIGIEFGFIMGIVMGLYFCLVDRYRQEAYRDSLARSEKEAAL